MQLPQPTGTPQPTLTDSGTVKPLAPPPVTGQPGTAQRISTTTVEPMPGAAPVGAQVGPTITPENTLRDKRLEFAVQPRDVQADRTADGVAQAFRSNLGFLNADFADQIEGLSKKTAAMGRTGSGMFAEEFGDISDRARATRESLLGNLTFQALQGDAQRALQASLANQDTDTRVGLAGANFMAGQQGREDSLARQAMQDRADQLRFLGTGFQTNPTGSISDLTRQLMAEAGMLGGNAGLINSQVQAAAAGQAQQPNPAVSPAVSAPAGPQIPSSQLPQIDPIPNVGFPSGPSLRDLDLQTFTPGMVY